MHRLAACLMLLLLPAWSQAACPLVQDSTAWREATPQDYLGPDRDALRARIDAKAWDSAHPDGGDGNDFGRASGDFDGDGRPDQASVLLHKDGHAAAIHVDFGREAGQPCRTQQLSETFYADAHQPPPALLVLPRSQDHIACGRDAKTGDPWTCVPNDAAVFDTRRGDALVSLDYMASAWYQPQASAKVHLVKMRLVERPAPPVRPDTPPEFPAPEQKNFTPFPTVLLDAQDAAGRYWSASMNIAFDIDAHGTLKLSADIAPIIGMDTDASLDSSCTAVGGGFNQRTAWFPYTALFVHGGELRGINDRSGRSLPLRPLRITENGADYAGPGARDPEYLFIPCVGENRVTAGHRLDRYLPLNALWEVRDSTGKDLRLSLPVPMAPYVLARYRSGAMIPVPMRAVVAAVDLEKRRVVIQFQTTIGHADLRKLEFRGIFPGDKPAEQETAKRHRERSAALLAELAGCAAPRLHAIEPCADAARRPDPQIFFPADTPKNPPKKKPPPRD